MRKPRVTLDSIAKTHQLKAVNKTIVRKGGEKLLNQQPKTSKKLG